ncbi:MAG: hypothetical protein FWE16_05245 [Firmicutes bacterium]|nr:hypothetical protein [Bacillota bacterium]
MDELLLDRSRPTKDVFKQWCIESNKKPTRKNRREFENLRVGAFLGVVANVLKQRMIHDDKVEAEIINFPVECVTEPTLKPEIRAKKKSNRFRFFAASVAVFFAVCISITMPMVFASNRPYDGPPDSGFGEREKYVARSQFFCLNEFKDILDQFEDTLIFEDIFDFERAEKEALLDDHDFVLSLTLTNALIVTSDFSLIFELDYRIRLYENYEFINYQQFALVNETFFVDEIEIHYIIVASDESYSVYLTFSYSGFDYFFQIRPVVDVYGDVVAAGEYITPLTKNNLIKIIELLFK